MLHKKLIFHTHHIYEYHNLDSTYQELNTNNEFDQEFGDKNYQTLQLAVHSGQF